jgi:hypothetical protein
MTWPKVCAIKGPAGEEELAELMKFAEDGWNIAFMDSLKEKCEQIRQKLIDEYNIKIFVVNSEDIADEQEYDIEAFFYHGSWDDEEDVDIFWGFIEARYGGVNYIIN